MPYRTMKTGRMLALPLEKCLHEVGKKRNIFLKCTSCKYYMWSNSDNCSSVRCQECSKRGKIFSCDSIVVNSCHTDQCPKSFWNIWLNLPCKLTINEW